MQPTKVESSSAKIFPTLRISAFTSASFVYAPRRSLVVSSHVRHIARTIGSDAHKVWNMVESTSGLVIKRFHEGGRKSVALNRELPIYRPLRRLLIAMDNIWPVKRIERSVSRWTCLLTIPWSPTASITSFNPPYAPACCSSSRLPAKRI